MVPQIDSYFGWSKWTLGKITIIQYVSTEPACQKNFASVIPSSRATSGIKFLGLALYLVPVDVIKTLFCLTNSMENHRCNEVERLVLVLTSHIIQKLIILPISTEERKFELVGYV